jgi:hypothetical protein
MGGPARGDENPSPLQGIFDGRPDLFVGMTGSGHVPIIDDGRPIVHTGRMPSRGPIGWSGRVVAGVGAAGGPIVGDLAFEDPRDVFGDRPFLAVGLDHDPLE